MRYVSADFAGDRRRGAADDCLDELDETQGTAGNRVFYLAVPPPAFATIVDGRSASGATRAAGRG